MDIATLGDAGANAPAPSQAAPDTSAQPQEQQQSTPESGAPDGQQPAAKAPVDPVQKRINTLTWKAHEAERRYNAELFARQQAEQRLAELTQQRFDAERRATMPTPEQYNLDPRAYQQAVEEHNRRFIEQQRQADQQTAQRMQQAQAQAQVEQAIQRSQAEGIEKFPDFMEVTGNPALPKLPTVNPPLFAALMQHEQSPELFYYLGKNPGDAHRIAAMPPARAIMEMGKIAASLSRQSKTSAAPEPPATVGGSEKGESSKPSDSDSVEVWMRKREAQLKKKRG